MTERGGRHDLAIGVAALLAALLLRALLLAARPVNPDLAACDAVAGLVERGGDIYRETPHYNYSPAWAGVLWLLARAGRPLGLPLADGVAALLFAADAASALLIHRILRARGMPPGRSLVGAGLFFANPVSVFVSSYRGMFDNLSILFLLLAALALTGERARRGRAVLWLSASLLVKHVAWFHPVLLLRRRREPQTGLAEAVVPYAVFAASFLPFWRSWAGIRENVFLYRSLDEPYGLEPIKFWRFVPEWAPAALFAGVCLFAAWRLREVEFGRGALLLFLVVLIFLPGVTPYYFVWPIALGALYPSAGYAVYTVMVSLFLIHSPDGLGVELSHLPGWSGPWWAAVFWLAWEVRGLQGRRVTGVSRAPRGG